MRNLSLTIFLMANIAACSDTQELEKQSSKTSQQKQNITQTVSTTEQKSVSNNEHEALQLTKKDPRIKQEGKVVDKNLIDKSLPTKNKYLSINKEKFELKSAELKKGAKVFNLLMSEAGTIKGTFAVVTKGSAALKEIKHTREINKIAQKTYRLTPEDGVSFTGYYKFLLSLEILELVEMEIDYSGPTRPLAELQ